MCVSGGGGGGGGLNVCVCVCVCCERVGESGVEDSRRQLGIKATDVNLSSVPSRQGEKISTRSDCQWVSPGTSRVCSASTSLR